MEGIDWTAIIAAVGSLAIGLVVGFYASWRKSVKADGVEDWKDQVVEKVDELASKIDESNKQAE